jgi:hypothetical protein
MPERKVSKIVVSEAGASVYSASAFAAAEFPQLDVSLRGAVSIARRLQDPLAELVKIEPKAIGVGSINTTSISARWRATSTPSSKIASTPSVSMSTRHRRRCSPACRG